jgi:hypothetical protein
MNSELFKVKAIDITRSALMAVGMAALTVIYSSVIATGFDVFTADWIGILKQCVNTSFITFVSVLAATFLTDSDGKLGGKI